MVEGDDFADVPAFQKFNEIRDLHGHGTGFPLPGFGVEARGHVFVDQRRVGNPVQCLTDILSPVGVVHVVKHGPALFRQGILLVFQGGDEGVGLLGDVQTPGNHGFVGFDKFLGGVEFQLHRHIEKGRLQLHHDEMEQTFRCLAVGDIHVHAAQKNFSVQIQVNVDVGLECLDLNLTAGWRHTVLPWLRSVFTTFI